ncbi:MAG: hypothetical protein C0404_02705 [Verrucomicrobia bacterium]|nr:hypothetical protein [Verrucomicrobiota bacterium]
MNTWDFGTRVTWFMLTDSRRKEDLSDSFYGSINELKARQNLLPVKFFAHRYLTPDLGIDFSWDQIKVTARKIGGHTDGTFDLKGPIVSLIGHYRKSTVCTPYAGAGFALMITSFDPDYNWKYAILPDTGEHKNGVAWSQNFYPDDALGLVVYAGATFNVAESWSVDFLVRYISMDLDFTHKNYVGDETTDSSSITFPMSSITVGIGVHCSM